MDREEARQRAEKLVGMMTIEEAASQIRFDAPGIERLGIPEYNWWNEALHGVARAGTATMFPQAIGLGATFDKKLLQDIGLAIGDEGRAKYNGFSKQDDRDIYKGLTYWSPNINIFRDPRWGRGHETYGEDPYLTGKLGVSFIKGLQKKDKDGFMKAAACAKHFAVHSGPESMRHHFNAEVSDKDLRETYLPAFETCVKEGEVEAVMGAYNRTNGEPCCGHSKLMQDILFKEWGFEGHFVSDCWAVKDFHENHKVTETPEESVTLALKSGCHVNCGCTYQRVLNAYELGMISEEDIRKAAVRLFTTRIMLGMFDATEFDAIPYSVVDCKKHALLNEKAAAESMVLLKNSGILPIDRKKVKTIAVIGPNADSTRALKGNYHGTASGYTTPLEGIQDEAGENIRVLYAEGCHLYMEKPDVLARPYNRITEARIVAREADLVILCLGLDETLEGEEGDAGNSDASGDKHDLSLPNPQIRLLEEIAQTGTPFVVCMLSGSALDLRYAHEHAAAIIQAWYPGARGGKVLADILFGKVSPSGKLPLTFYADLEEYPEFTDYSMKGRTYRYIEKAPLYPFGYGLTYGDTAVISAHVSLNGSHKEGASYAEAAKKGVTVDMVVNNRSDIACEEVIQIYVKVKGSANEVRNHKLAAFERIRIDGHEMKKISLKVDAVSFTTVDDNGVRSADGTGALIYAGTGQPDGRTGELTGTEMVCVEI